MRARTHAHARTHTLTHSHTHTLTHSHAHTLTHSLLHAHTHTQVVDEHAVTAAQALELRALAAAALTDLLTTLESKILAAAAAEDVAASSVAPMVPAVCLRVYSCMGILVHRVWDRTHTCTCIQARTHTHTHSGAHTHAQLRRAHTSIRTGAGTECGAGAPPRAQDAPPSV